MSKISYTPWTIVDYCDAVEISQLRAVLLKRDSQINEREDEIERLRAVLAMANGE